MPERISEGGDINIKEGRERLKTTEMSRVVICRSRTLAELEKELNRENIDWDNINFTRILMVEKTKESTAPNQMMPVGGRKWVEDKDALATALRNMLLKTHLRPSKIGLLNGQPINHKIDRVDKETGEIAEENLSTYYFFATVAPFDKSYPIDPKASKILKFHEIGHEDWEKLKNNEPTEGEGEQATLLDSLRQPEKPAPGESNEEFANRSLNVSLVRTGLESNWQTVEFTKMRRIYYFFTKIAGLDNDFEKKLSNDMSLDTKMQSLRQQFKEIFEDNDPGLRDALKQAVDLSNLEDELGNENTNNEQSRFETLLRFMYVLLESKFRVDDYLEVAKKNIHLKDFVEKLENFIDSLSSGADVNDREKFSNQIMAIDSLDDELLEEAFYESFFPGTNKKDLHKKFVQMNLAINLLIDHELAADHVCSLLEDIDDSLLRQLPEISSANIADLLKAALPGVGKDQKRRMKASSIPGEEYQTDERQVKRFVFEARRKLALFILLEKYDDIYEEIINNGDRPINKIFEKVFGAPLIKCHLIKEVEIDSSSESHKAKDEKVVRTQEYYAPTEESKKDPKFSSEKFIAELVKELPRLPSGHVYRHEEIRLRACLDDEGKNLFSVSQHPRPKERFSWYRKALVRGSERPEELNNDIFGRALVISPRDNSKEARAEILARSKATFNICSEDRGKMVCKDQMVEDYMPVIEILKRISAEPGVKIINFKPTNKSGESFASSMGKGDKICLAKFYVRHTDQKGVIRDEEIQIFSPTPDGKSGYDHRNDKITADSLYKFRRLHDVKGWRSGVEIIFPRALYPIPKIMNNQKELHTAGIV